MCSRGDQTGLEIAWRAKGHHLGYSRLSVRYLPGQRNHIIANFTEISKKYENDSVIQQSASEILFELLDIQPNDDVLDLGCGTGHLSKLIRGKTNGRVVGVDFSRGMIEKAQEKFSSHAISFHVSAAEHLDFNNEFNIIFCNSAFQWFIDPAKALRACFHALKTGGKMAIQAPARENYCPNFLQAIEEVKNHQATQHIFRSFSPPWFFRNHATDYTELFEQAGFMVEKSTIDEVVTFHTAEEAYKIFESGAAAGYLNQEYYPTKLSPEYVETFREIVRDSFEIQAGETKQVKLFFYRIYLLAKKLRS